MSELSFPSRDGENLGVAHWVNFRGYEPEKGWEITYSGDEQLSTKPKVSIYLPAPQNIQENNSQQYQNLNFDTFAVGGEVIDKLTKDLGQSTSIGEGIGTIVSNAVSEGGAIAELVGGQLLRQAPMAAQAELLMNGTVRNPREQKHFQSPAFRTFSYTWELASIREDHPEKIQNVINAFRKWTAPSVMQAEGAKEGFEASADAAKYVATYKTPLVWKVSHMMASGDGTDVSATNKWGVFGVCVITDVNVNYNGAGVYAASNASAPTFVNLTVNFSEQKLHNRESLEKIMNDPTNRGNPAPPPGQLGIDYFPGID